jgi:2'-5' RNA ligase
MFPVPESIGEEQLVNHLWEVLRERRPFPIHLQGLAKSCDDYLFLLVDEGKDALADLHAHMYTGVLSDFRRTDLPYVPHITLGLFGDDRNEYLQAVNEAQRLDLNYRCVMDKLHLVKIDDQRIRIMYSREFLLT